MFPGEPSSKRLRLLGPTLDDSPLTPAACVPLRFTDSFMAYLNRPNSQGKIPPKRIEGPSPFDRISDEIMVKIFSYLPRSSLGKCAPVCKRFRRIAIDDALWKAIKLYKKTVPPGILGNIFERDSVKICSRLTSTK